MNKNRPIRSAEKPPHWQVVEQALAKQWRGKGSRRRHRENDKAAAPKPKPPTVYLTSTLVRQTAKLLGPTSPQPSPDVVYWLGFELEDRACVTTLVVPDTDTREHSSLTAAVASDEALATAADAPLVLLGQARALQRSGDATLPRTPRDRDISSEGVFTVEILAFTKAGFDLASCAVFRQIDGKRRQITADEMDEHLRVLPGYKDLRKRRQMASRPANGLSRFRRS